MRTKSIVSSLAAGAALLAGAWVAGGVRAADDDIAGVKKQCAAFVDAWNAHDPKAMAALFAEDGDAINPHGRVATGRAEVEKMFTDEHKGTGPLRESTIAVKSETVRFPA